MWLLTISPDLWWRAPNDPLNVAFPDKHLMAIFVSRVPWFADIANYLALGILLHDLSSHQKKKFFYDVKH